MAEGRRDRTRIVVMVFLASAIHALTFRVLLFSRTSVHPPHADAEDLAATELAIDVISEARNDLHADMPPQSYEALATHQRRSDIGNAVSARESTGESVATPSETAAPIATEPSSASSAAPSVGVSWGVRLPPPDLWLDPAAVARLTGTANTPDTPSPASAPISKTGGLVEALDQRDLDRGLGRGGAVRTAVELGARSADAPVRGNATFAVSVFSDGHVAVELADAPTEWSRIVPAIRDGLRRANVRVPPNSRGLRVVVAVEAIVRYPDGYAPPDKTKVTGHGSVGASNGTVADGAPIVTVGVEGRRCAAQVAVMPGGLGAYAGCSAGVATRTVATRIVREERL